MLTYVLLGAPRTKKNSQRIFKGWGGQPFLVPSAAYAQYEKDCLQQIRPPRQPVTAAGCCWTVSGPGWKLRSRAWKVANRPAPAYNPFLCRTNMRRGNIHGKDRTDALALWPRPGPQVQRMQPPGMDSCRRADGVQMRHLRGSPWHGHRLVGGLGGLRDAEPELCRGQNPDPGARWAGDIPGPLTAPAGQVFRM